MSGATIHEKRRIWSEKPALRTVYEDIFSRVLQYCRQGDRSLEIGAGASRIAAAPGNDVIVLDIQDAPWLDVVADAQSLPFATGSFDNILMIDVLHHLALPERFFEEAVRVLQPGGRIVLAEPAITLVSRLPLTYWHPEPVDTNIVSFSGDRLSSANPDDANQAIPTLLFGRDRKIFEKTFPQLEIQEIRYLSLWAYPLSGGFRQWGLLTSSMAKGLLTIENMVPQGISRFLAFRMLVVLESHA